MTTAPVGPGPEVFPDPDAPPLSDPDLDPDVFPPDPAEPQPETEPGPA